MTMNRFPDWPNHAMAGLGRSQGPPAPRKTIREASRAWSELLRGAKPDLAAGFDVLDVLTQETAADIGDVAAKMKVLSHAIFQLHGDEGIVAQLGMAILGDLLNLARTE